MAVFHSPAAQSNQIISRFFSQHVGVLLLSRGCQPPHVLRPVPSSLCKDGQGRAATTSRRICAELADRGRGRIQGQEWGREKEAEDRPGVWVAGFTRGGVVSWAP